MTICETLVLMVAESPERNKACKLEENHHYHKATTTKKTATTEAKVRVVGFFCRCFHGRFLV